MGVYLGVIHASLPKWAECQRSPMFGVLLYLRLHPLTQNDQIWHCITYGGRGMFSGQTRHCICTNASRGLSATAECLVLSHVNMMHDIDITFLSVYSSHCDTLSKWMNNVSFFPLCDSFIMHSSRPYSAPDRHYKIPMLTFSEVQNTQRSKIFGLFDRKHRISLWRLTGSHRYTIEMILKGGTRGVEFFRSSLHACSNCLTNGDQIGHYKPCGEGREGVRVVFHAWYLEKFFGWAWLFII